MKSPRFMAQIAKGGASPGAWSHRGAECHAPAGPAKRSESWKNGGLMVVYPLVN